MAVVKKSVGWCGVWLKEIENEKIGWSGFGSWKSLYFPESETNGGAFKEKDALAS